MKIEQARINRLLTYLDEKRAVYEQLHDSLLKECALLEIQAIELALITLGVPFK